MVISVAYVASRNLSYQHTDEDAQTKIRNKLNYVQGVSEQLIKVGMDDILYQIVSSVSSEPDLVSLLIVNQDDKIVASNNFSETGKNWRELSANFDQALIREVKRQKKTIVVGESESRYMEGYVSICTKKETRSLRGDQCGFSVYRISLAYHYALSSQALNLQSFYFTLGLTITIITMFVLMHFLLNMPALKIIASLDRFNDGDHETRIDEGSSNEISLISSAINEVLDTVVIDENALKDKEERLRAIFNNTIDSIITISSKGIIQTVNPATETLLGYKDEELIGKNISIITAEAHRNRHDQYIADYLETGERNIISSTRELRAVTKQGKEIPIALTVSEIEINGERCFTGIIRDITEALNFRESLSRANEDLLASNRELKKVSRTDSLTGIANRGHFDEILEVEIRRATRSSNPLSLILLDIDYFKLYNDCYGHSQGDHCLQSVASSMRNCFLRAGELAARYGGEEFGVILPGTDEQRAHDLAEGVRASIYQLGMTHEKSPTIGRVTVSVGVTTLLPESSELISRSDLIVSADKALYQAKSCGRNTVCTAVISSEQFAPTISATVSPGSNLR
ncbi:MAG: diguanylate cyclase [Gammaproteobacteria bacterium]|nr:diguanylate cyclase [Gammaproteobacteria bacterium]